MGHFWLKRSRRYDWTTLAAIRKPSTIVILLIPALATIRQISAMVGIYWNLPLRPWLLVVGTLIPVAGWALIQLLCPRTVKLAADATALKRAGALPTLVTEFEKDADAAEGAYEHRDLVKTISAILPAVPRGWAENEPTRGELFQALRAASNLKLEVVMTAAREFFNHINKRTQTVVGAILLTGVFLQIASVAIATYQLLGSTDMWIPFNGQAVQTAEGWLLTPAEDKNVRIEVEADDLRYEDRRFLLRVGAKALSIDIPAGSPVNTKPIRKSKPTCAGNISRCVGGIEFCCDDSISGACNGQWNDCSSSAKKEALDIPEVTNFRGAPQVDYSKP